MKAEADIAAEIARLSQMVERLEKRLEAKASRSSVSAAALYSALKGLLPYRAHDSGCAVDQTDFCTCGMKQKADAARKALRDYEQNDDES